MRFIDYNGTGRIDLQDIATSIAIEQAERDGERDDAPNPKNGQDNPPNAPTSAAQSMMFPSKRRAAADQATS